MSFNGLRARARVGGGIPSGAAATGGDGGLDHEVAQRREARVHLVLVVVRGGLQPGGGDHGRAQLSQAGGWKKCYWASQKIDSKAKIEISINKHH